MNKIIFSVEAVLTMVSDGYRAGKNMETGGVLVGPRNVRGVITDVIPSTEHAQRSAATYFQTEEDTQHLNKVLKRHQVDGKDYLGDYHQHTPGIIHLSHGDLNTCTDIITDPDYAVDNELIMVIVTATNNISRPPIYVYRVSLNSHGRAVVEELSFEILPKKWIEKRIISNRNRKLSGGKHEKDDTRHGDEEATGDDTGTDNKEARVSVRA